MGPRGVIRDCKHCLGNGYIIAKQKIMPSNVTHTCIPCRYSAKQTFTCPYCNSPMTYMGKAFKPPRKSNNTQWRKVELLVTHDIRFGYCSCHRPRKVIKSLTDAKNLCKTRRADSKTYANIDNVKTRQIRNRISWKGRDY